MVLGLIRPNHAQCSGCNKNAVIGGVCIAHGAKRACMIVGVQQRSVQGKEVSVSLQMPFGRMWI
jgi:transcriptional regulatory protein LevR